MEYRTRGKATGRGKPHGRLIIAPTVRVAMTGLAVCEANDGHEGRHLVDLPCLVTL